MQQLLYSLQVSTSINVKHFSRLLGCVQLNLSELKKNLKRSEHTDLDYFPILKTASIKTHVKAALSAAKRVVVFENYA